MPSPSPLLRPDRHASADEVIVSEHLAELRGRVRLLIWVSGLCWTALVMFGGLLVTGLLDWCFHFDESGTRFVLSVALVAGSGWIAWRYLIAPLCLKLSSTFLAMRVERRFPGLNNRIVSAVEFLEHRLDTRVGSSELQKAVVKQAIHDLEKVNTSDVISLKSIKSITIAGSIVCAVAALVAVLWPREAITSVRRLAMPFSNVPWPRAVEFELVRADLSPLGTAGTQPILIVRGDTLELYARNRRGRLPQRVWFEYRVSDEGPVMRESLRQAEIRDEEGKAYETAIVNWIATRGTMSFRVTGGDDDTMPFHQVEVVIPPAVESLQVTLTPPAYSRFQPEKLSPGVGHVQGLVGTKVEAEVSSDKDLKSAVLRVGNELSIPIELQEDKRRFTTAFVISEPGVSSYWFELTDLRGFADHEAIRYELRGIPDQVPEVVIESPVSDVALTADAVLPMKVLAKDDLGLKDVRLSYRLGESGEPRIIPLLGGSIDAVNPNDLAAVNHPQQYSGDYEWKIAELKLEPGAMIVVHAEATDDNDLGEPHIGKSIPRTITIVTRDEKQKELATRVGNLLEELQRATALQQRSRQQTEELQTQVENVGQLRSQDVDQLRRTEMDQRQAAARLNNPSDGIESQAGQLLEEFKSNQIADNNTEEKLERLSQELDRLEREELPAAEQALTQAQKLAEEESNAATDKQAEQPNEPTDAGKQPEKSRELAEALAEAKSRQTRTLDTLQELQDSLSEWREQRDVTRDIDSVIAEQQAMQKAAEELAQRTMAKNAAELSKQDKAEFSKLSARQEKIADQLDQFSKQLEKAAESLEKNDPESAEKLNEILQEMKQHETASKLRDAAHDIADHKLGLAEKLQQDAMEEMQEVERMVKKRPTDDTEQFLKQTEEALQEFQQLRQEQQDLTDQAEDLAKQPDSAEKQEQMKNLLEKQEELAERMAKAERKLERLRLRGAADAAHRARQRITEMMKHAREADDGEETQQAMNEAMEDLEQVERELTLEKRIAQERLAFEQLEKMEDELKSLRARQEAVVEETVRLDAAKAERETLTRGQLKTLKDLSETERSLQQVAESLKQQMSSIEVLSLYLKHLARSFRLAADRLSDRETGNSVQALEKDILRKIDHLMEVLKQETAKKDQAQPPEEPSEPKENLAQEPQEQEQKPEDARPPGESVPELAQLKLLKAMQESYLERTEFLESQRGKDGTIPEPIQSELTELAVDQNELADLARRLLARFQQQQDPKSGEEEANEEGKKLEKKPKTSNPADEKSENKPMPDPDKKPNPKENDPTKIDL